MDDTTAPRPAPDARVPGRADIEAAAARIAGHVRRTPVVEIEGGALGLDRPVTLKLELLQRGGSFKPRGAFNTLLGAAPPDAGVVAASGGNHGIAVALAAASLGVPARIFVPSIAAPAKIAAIRAQGVEPDVVPGAYAEAAAAAERWVAESGAMPVHPYDAPATVAGQGTVGLEVMAQAPGLDVLLVAVGGGGLIGGIAAACAGGPRIVGVETEGTASLTRALAEGPEAEIEVSGIAADALGARRIGRLGHASAVAHGVGTVVVADAEVAEAQRRLWSATRVLAEPAGAAALAALTSGRLRPAPGARVGVLVCGGNVDPASVEF